MARSVVPQVPHLDALDAVLIDVRTLVQRPRYRRRLLSSMGRNVDLGTMRVLRAVERLAGQDPCVADIADVLVVDRSSASRLVERCVSDGLLDRRTSDQDRRRSRLELTAAGRSLLGRASAVRRQLLNEVTSGWPEADVARLVELLMRLKAGFDRLETAP